MAQEKKDQKPNIPDPYGLMSTSSRTGNHENLILRGPENL